MAIDHTHYAKVILIGDSGVGKTCLVQRLAGKDFNEIHQSTIGVDFESRVTDCSNSRRLKTHIWDTAGQDRFRAVTKNFYRGADAVIFVYDVTNADSFVHLDNWLREVEEVTGTSTNKPYHLMLGNKSDSHRRIVDRETAETFAAERGLAFSEVSARSGANVEEAFKVLEETVLSNARAAENPPEDLDEPQPTTCCIIA